MNRDQKLLLKKNGTISKCVTEKRLAKLEKVLSKRQANVTLVLENINDRHNVSAVIRSCDAVGILNIYLIYYGKQPVPKLGNASSASAKKWVDMKMFHSVDECFNELRAQGKKIYTTHMSRDAKSLYDMDLTDDIALVFGNEHVGVSDEAVDKADGNFLIPQVGMIQSLNISVACAVSLYEVFRQRKNAGKYDELQMSQLEYKERLDDWLSR